MSSAYESVNTQPSDTKNINNSECKDKGKLNTIVDDNDFNIVNNNNQSQYIDSNVIQITRENVKVENITEMYENDKQFTFNMFENLSPQNTLIEFDKIYNDYHIEKLIKYENIAQVLDIKESLLNFDVLDLVNNNINVSNEKTESIENCYTDKNEYEKLEKLNKFLKLNKKDDNFTIKNNSLESQVSLDILNAYQEINNTEIKVPPLTGESFTTEDNKEINSLRKFRKVKKTPINNEAFCDFEDNIKINEIYISKNNIDILHNIKTDYKNNINSGENTSKETDNKYSKHTSTFDNIPFSSDEDSKNITINNPNESYDSDNDYHSSDFESIDEDEAKKTGYIINNNSNKLKSFKEIENTSSDSIIYDYFYLPIESKYGTDKESHTIPNGVDYISLFGGNYTPLPTLGVENKAINAGTSMSTGCSGIGFDMRMLQDSPELEAYREEAHESERKILSLYPVENRRKRRRRY